MIKKRTLYLLVIIIGGFWGFLFYNHTYSNEAILEKVTKRDGYTLNLIKNNEMVEFYIKPEWIPYTSNKEKKLNIKLTSLNNTNILLNEVGNRGDDIYFNFETTYDMSFHKGSFLYNGIFNEDGSFTTESSSHEYYIYSKNNEQISVEQTGQGPESSFGFSISKENVHLLKNGFYVKYYGFYTYEYHKN